MTPLTSILSATLLGGFLSIGAAALASLGWPKAWIPRLVGFSVGVLLATALLRILPEAIEVAAGRHLDPAVVFSVVLAGILGFFALERVALWRHAHHETCHHDPGAHEPGTAMPAATLILVGDGVHNFVDGILIAAAFLADASLGVATTIAVITHEIPQEVGDFLLLRAAGWGRAKALLANGASSLTSVAGGLFGYFLMADAQALLPHALALAAASLLYVAIADLLPFLHRQRHDTAFVWQIGLIGLGVLAVTAIGHGH
jgi:zinc and cadmium transporter